MKTTKIEYAFKALMVFLSIMLFVNCGGDDSSDSQPSPSISVNTTVIQFPATDVLSVSASQGVEVNASNLTGSLNISVTSNFQVSLDDSNFSSQISVSSEDANASTQLIYVRFSPGLDAVGNIVGTLTIQSAQATTVTKSLSGIGISITPVINVNNTSLSFADTMIGQQSESQQIAINGDNLDSEIDLSVNGDFVISLDNNTFSNSVQIAANDANDQFSLYVKFLPSSVGEHSGTISIQNSEAQNVDVTLSGEGTPITHSYVTFDEQATGFGGGFTRSVEGTFTVHSDISNISQIKMFVKIDCPTTGCDDWDRFANVKVREPNSGNWYEIGRYITPYWVGTQQLDRGLEFDVTDFKSLLTGTVDLRIFVDNWTAKADLITVEFDYVEGTPDYPYYAISEIMPYHQYSEVPYGESHAFDLTKQIGIPANAESTHLRTIISGWGHATPNDADGRPCAEWCYRTHDVKINGTNTFQHYLGPLGCASNPINNQNPGNWQPDRAGWCPGMAVPERIDEFSTSMAGSTFTFEYDFEDWVNDMINGQALYGLSTYVIVKSNTVISAPTITD